MQVIRSYSADQALSYCLSFIRNNPAKMAVSYSRNGDVLRFKEPLASVYENPRHRVLFNAVRDNNPFFSVFESLWMLAGRNDLRFVSYLLKNMENYSDDGMTLNGAYGHRWRKHFHTDQLKFIIDELRKDPNSRRAHLQMWDPFRDLELLTGPGSRDVPCNTAVDFEIQDGKLNMMVSNRSNDLIWGAYGANIVHFSFLQEYIACALGVDVGVYTQVSRNAHIYLDNPVTNRLITQEPPFRPSNEFLNELNTERFYRTSPVLFDVDELDNFEADLASFFASFDDSHRLNKVNDLEFSTPFMREVVSPLAVAFELYKDGNYTQARDYINQSNAKSIDWLVNAAEWLQRRIVKRNSK